MKQTGLYFVGEAIADQRPDPENARRMQVSLGGSMYFGSMGAAKALRRQGVRDCHSFYVGPVSSDYFGQIIHSDFIQAGVKTDYVRRSDFISMIAVVSEDGKGGNKYSFYGRNQPNTTEHLHIEDLPAEFKEERRFFCFGSVATTLSPSGQTLKKFAQAQTKNRSICLYDPNTRPSVIPDAQAYRLALENWVSVAPVVKASDEDIAFTYPDLGQETVAQRWLNLGAKAVFITQGPKGCIVYSQEGKRHVDTQAHQKISSTVGAGDNFNAGILIGLASSGIAGLDDLDFVPLEDWEKIAAIANATSYAHLLELNSV